MEVFCNRVAAAVLMPLEALQSEAAVKGHFGQEWSDETLSYLSRRYRVSRQAVLLRLLSLDLTTGAFYQTFEQSLRSVKAKPKKKESGGGPHPVTMTIVGASIILATCFLECGILWNPLSKTARSKLLLR